VAGHLFQGQSLPPGIFSSEALLLEKTGWSWQQLMGTPESVLEELEILWEAKAKAEAMRRGLDG